MCRIRAVAKLFLASTAMLTVIVPVAQAATYYYSDSKASEWQFRYSGQRPQITGGMAKVYWSFDGVTPRTHIETYYPAPGYTTVARATGSGTTWLSHRRVYSARQKCAWDWPWAGGDVGSIRLTCYARS